MATMNTAVATKMPARSPLASPAGMIGAITGRNSPGRAFATKNRISGPISRMNLSVGLSWALPSVMVDPLSEAGARLSRADAGDCLGKIRCGKWRQIFDTFTDPDEVH